MVDKDPSVAQISCAFFYLFIPYSDRIHIISGHYTAAVFWHYKKKNNFLYSFYNEKYNLGPIYTLIVVDCLCFIYWMLLVFPKLGGFLATLKFDFNCTKPGIGIDQPTADGVKPEGVAGDCHGADPERGGGAMKNNWYKDNTLLILSLSVYCVQYFVSLLIPHT